MWLLLVILVFLWLGTSVMKNCIDIWKYIFESETKQENKKHKLEE